MRESVKTVSVFNKETKQKEIKHFCLACGQDITNDYGYFKYSYYNIITENSLLIKVKIKSNCSNCDEVLTYEKYLNLNLGCLLNIKARFDKTLKRYFIKGGDIENNKIQTLVMVDKEDIETEDIIYIRGEVNKFN